MHLYCQPTQICQYVKSFVCIRNAYYASMNLCIRAFLSPTNPDLSIVKSFVCLRIHECLYPYIHITNQPNVADISQVLSFASQQCGFLYLSNSVAAHTAVWQVKCGSVASNQCGCSYCNHRFATPFHPSVGFFLLSTLGWVFKF